MSTTLIDLVDFAFVRQTILSSEGITAAALGLLAIVFFNEAYHTKIPKIEGIPQVPGALPFVGHLHKLGGRLRKNDASVFTEWSNQIKSNIFQIVMGDHRAVVIRDWATMHDIWVGQTHSLSDRPDQPGFLEKLGVDLTGQPMSNQIRKCRAAGMKALAKAAWPRYYPLLEPSSSKFINIMVDKGKNGQVGIETYPYLRQIVFDLALSLTYGARFGEVDDDFILTFIKSINEVSAVRSSSRTFRHFVPILRIIPEFNSRTIAAEKVRRKHRDILYNRYKDRVAAGETVDCIMASLDEDNLTIEEVHGICISLLQAAPDTIATSVYLTVAWLSSPEGAADQAACLQAILDAYDGDRTKAYKMAFREEKVPLITSLCKEVLRWFTFSPYVTPRKATKDVIGPNGVVIPKGTDFIMNAQEINHDRDHFGPDAWEFRADRFIDNKSALPSIAFGAGVRICPAVNISNRLIVALTTRLLLAFDMKASTATGRAPIIHPINFSDVHDQLVAHPKLYDCHFTPRDPIWLRTVVDEELATSVAAL